MSVTPPSSDSDVAPIEPHRASAREVAEVFTTFLKLGCLSFGGPIAHLGYLRAEVVEQKKWLDERMALDVL